MKSITRFTNNIRGNKCLNCGTAISEDDNFCSTCGQVNDTQRLSVKQYFSEYLSGFFNFDNRFLKTVIPLIFKPGKVSKNYIDGMRMKYVNPFQLYLHITILFFLAVGIFKTIDKFKPVEELSKEAIGKLNTTEKIGVLDSIKEQTLKELQENDVPIDTATVDLIETGVQQLTINADSLELKQEQNLDKLATPLNHYIDSLMTHPGLLTILKNPGSSTAEKDTAMNDVLELMDSKAAYLTRNDSTIMINSWTDVSKGWTQISKKNKLKKKAILHIDSILIAEKIKYTIPLSLVRQSDDSPDDSGFERLLRKLQYFVDYQKSNPDSQPMAAIKALDYEKNYWNVFLYTKSADMVDGFENPNSHYGDEIVDRILSRISVALFFLLPVFTLLVSLLYIRRKFNYTENLVFVFHVQTVFFLFLLIFLLVGRLVNSQVVIPIFLLTFMIYLYKAMRTFYGQGRIKTLIKYILLNSAFIVLALIGGIIISFIAFLI